MKESVAGFMACSSCRGALEPLKLDGAAGTIDYGVLSCRHCRTGLPVLAGFVHAGNPLLVHEAPTLEMLLDLERRLLPRFMHYAEAVRAQGKRSWDSYAAFQPFNESTRALYPLLPHVRLHLKPGDVILDTWCRTGFSGALLAGLFPEQHVISLWEGNRGVLGFEGFRHWLGGAARPANWDIVFTDPARGLPFADATFAFIHGLDSLHRYPFQPFLSDCLRTGTPRGAIVFPHVHLANSDPEPFFERGGEQLHGTRYRDYFDRMLAGSRRRAFVLSERSLFELAQPTPLVDDAATAHYNGVVAILDAAHALLPLAPAESMLSMEDRPALQPLIEIDRMNGAVRLVPGRADEMLARHPCYAERLARVLPPGLSPTGARIWAWIEAGANWAEIGANLGLEPAALCAEARTLCTPPIGAAMSRLQAFHVSRDMSPALSDQGFASLWARLAAEERSVLRAEDGSAFGSNETRTLVNAIAHVLIASGVGPGSRVALVAGAHAEAILAVWACWLSGAVLLPVDPALPTAQRAALLERLAPDLLLVDVADANGVPELHRVDRARRTSVALGALIEEHLESPMLAVRARESDPAAILSTSGSSGHPKGVILRQGALYRGARTLARAYGVQPADVLCCPGGLHTMSGLRNNCVLPLLAGATIAALDARHFSHPVAAAAACRNHAVSVLSIVPAFIHALRRAGGPLAFGSLRQILCTGASLASSAHQEVEQMLGVPVHVYYGLTESGGVCTLVEPGMKRLADGDIGVPADAWLRLVDGAGQPVTAPGAVGELEIFSANLMLGYCDEVVGDPGHGRLRDGWLRSGDLARLQDGHVILCGRMDDMIKTRQGLALHPSVIEEALCAHPDVSEAAVLALDSADGPVLQAWLISRGAVADDWLAGLHRWLGERLGPQFMPDRLVVVPALPRVANGKVARAALRDEAWSQPG
jgi:acyl-coenzyme A synthetase/AMP-(fatty) acid ligase